DDVLHQLGRFADLKNPATEGSIRISVHRELGRLAHFQLSDIGLIDLPCTSISRRSFAILNNVLASRLTATVWPGLTSRLMMIPSIGAPSRVRSRSSRA